MRFSGRRLIFLWLAAATLSGCASQPLTQSGVLTSYDGLAASNGLLTTARVRIDVSQVAAARTVSLTPMIVAPGVSHSSLTAEQLRYVANAANRATCAGLERRFRVVGPGEPADLRVRAVLTQATTTDVAAAGASSVLNIGGAVASAVTRLPLNAPRLPLGLGGLSAETEALNNDGKQVAAMVWARGADAFTVHARVAEEADAYALAGEFGADVARFLVDAESPFGAKGPQAPDAQSLFEYFGAQPKSRYCASFGANPGLAGTLGSQIGLPPRWTDPAL